MNFSSPARALALAIAFLSIATTVISDDGVYTYVGMVPTVSGDTFTSTMVPTWVTNSLRWTGTIWIKGTEIKGLDPNVFGNASSTLKLSGVWGYFKDSGNAALTCLPSIELSNDNNSYQYGFYVTDGYSREGKDEVNINRIVVINKLKGDGEIWTGYNASTVLMNVRNWSNFSGKIQLVNKIVVFGEYVPPSAEFNTAGAIYIGSGDTVSIPTGKQWRADGGIHVHGIFKATDIGTNQLRADTTVVTYEDGVFVLTSSGNGVATEAYTDYSRISGLGTLKYEGAGWRAVSTNNFPTRMMLWNEQAGDLVLTEPGITYTIGGLKGAGNLQANYVNLSAARNLCVQQAKDSEWSGKIKDDSQNRFGTLFVAPGVESTGTLTLSGTQTQRATLAVETNALVKLTGTWVGPVTVAGMLGGTGTITGNLTLSDGATLNVVDVNTPLNVSGDFSATGTIKVHLPAGADLSHLKTILLATGTMNVSGATFLVTEVGGEPQDPALYSVKMGKNRLFVTGNHGHRAIFR